ncbi:MAG TPA: hypothetical protein VMV18_14645 [bacterium]|nr:hypothetical protein [bacterium]
MRSLPLAIAAAVAAVALAAPRAHADEPTLRMQAEAGMGNVVRGGVWTPVTVELENPGAGFNGRVVVEFADVGMTRGTAAEPVELPTGAKKRLVLYARPRGGPQQFAVSVEDARGRVRAGPVQIPLTAVEDRTAIVALVSMGARGDPGMRALITADTRVVALDADQLPEAWPALRALDALVLRDPDVATLGPARVEAIKEWVSAGGNLVVTSAEKWRAMDDPSFTELLPVRVKGVRTASAAELPFPFSEHSGDIAVAVTEPLRGTVLVGGPGGAPFAAQARYGMGRVVFLAADPGALPDVDPGAKTDLWAGLLALPAELKEESQPGYYYGVQSPESFISQELSRIPPLRPPSVVLVTLLIGLYVLAVGPGDYFLLRRMKKMHWTWATYPAAIAVFSALIYGYARLSRSSDMMIRTLRLVDAPAEPPGAPSPVHVFGGVYSPRAGRFEVDVGLPHAVSGGFAEDNPYMGSTSSTEYLTAGGKHPMLGLSIPIWSMAGVDLTSATTEPAPFLVEKDGSGWKITNTGSAPLEYVGLLVDNAVVDGGKLESGGAITLSRTMSGHRLAELPGEMSQAMFGDAHSKEDLSRIARVFAYASDPPLTDAGNDPYYVPRTTRHLGLLERPRTDRRQPVVLAIARDTSLPISVRGEIAAGSGLTIWRRSIASSTGGKNP